MPERVVRRRSGVAAAGRAVPEGRRPPSAIADAPCRRGRDRPRVCRPGRRLAGSHVRPGTARANRRSRRRRCRRGHGRDRPLRRHRPHERDRARRRRQRTHPGTAGQGSSPARSGGDGGRIGHEAGSSMGRLAQGRSDAQWQVRTDRIRRHRAFAKMRCSARRRNPLRCSLSPARTTTSRTKLASASATRAMCEHCQRSRRAAHSADCSCRRFPKLARRQI